MSLEPLLDVCVTSLPSRSASIDAPALQRNGRAAANVAEATPAPAPVVEAPGPADEAAPKKKQGDGKDVVAAVGALLALSK